jgi:hypothetical protein
MIFGILVGTYSSIFGGPLILFRLRPETFSGGGVGSASFPNRRSRDEWGGIVVREAHFPGRSPIEAWQRRFPLVNMSHAVRSFAFHPAFMVGSPRTSVR